MSCDEWIRGDYWIRNKTEYNKLIKAVVKGYNEDIAEINEAIKAYKASTRKRDSIDWSKFSYNTDRNWRLQDLIGEHWKRRGGIPKATNKSIDISGVSFSRDANLVFIDVQQNNWAVERWWCMPGVDSLFKNLDNVKWSQRNAKDGGYLSYWNEYYRDEGNGEPSYQNYFGRKGQDMESWARGRPC